MLLRFAYEDIDNYEDLAQVPLESESSMIVINEERCSIWMVYSCGFSIFTNETEGNFAVFEARQI